MRVDGKLPDEPLLHACMLTYASDISLLDSVLSKHGAVWGSGGFVGASLGHAVWFHRPFRAAEWFLYGCASPSAADVRGQRPEDLGYHGAAAALQDVWIALRASERLILETVTIEDVVSGELPE